MKFTIILNRQMFHTLLQEQYFKFQSIENHYHFKQVNTS